MSATAPDSRDAGWQNRLVQALAIVIPALLLIALFWPGFDGTSGRSRRPPCVNNLKQLGIALYNYHDTFKQFPPVYVADERGRPMHSWRVLLLPYFESPEFQQLAREYDFK